MTPAQLSRTIRHVLPHVLPDGEAARFTGDGPSGSAAARIGGVRVVVESPPRRGPGDYATGVAFQIAAACGRPAQELAQQLCARLEGDVDAVGGAEVVGGGFVNVTLTNEARVALLRTLTESGSAGAAAPTRTAEPPRTAAPTRTAEPTLVAEPFRTAAPPRTADQRAPSDAGAPPTAPTDYATPPTASPDSEAPPTAPTDVPARDIPRWAAVTGEDPAVLAVRTERASSLFRVQYAHARVCSLLRNGRRLGLRPDAEGAVPLDAAGARLLALLADRARITAAGPLARHLDAVAQAFAAFHDVCPPLPRGEEKPGAAHRGRLALAEATGAVLAGGLSQLGVSAPAHL
ncbi:DALR anticodon-binding domain-containing protein [Streptomyces qinglanensis]|uniref:arginine--tRNA ligase n=1 Tax=Streptomyces qinglanensis TaxID=943816 RepID=A0A1H9V5S5_9ACTN|nr:DALR anticodon-binding domain-containing protein [Streptomyces qinglanensis]SES16623.1 arginyl-tRNA synthetase [Streptomyces qinglanensis]